MKKHIVLIISGVLLAALAIVFLAQSSSQQSDSSNASRSIYGFAGSGCNVATLDVGGFLSSEESTDTPVSSWDVSQAIRNMDFNDKKALVVFLDSDGGTPAAADEIATALGEVHVPTVAYVRGDALSGGYWIAASTDHIVALKTALIGNVGVNSSFLNQTESDKQSGVTYEQITSGRYKDAGSIDKPLSVADREFLQGVNDDLFQIFTAVVTKGRGFTTQQFAAVADGKFYVASKALKLGLIDEIGDINTVENYISSKTGTNLGDINLCPFPQY